eukprot:COSAG01_NODE_104_length_26171_cov_96.617612_7_plen_49_part_00
MSSATPSHAMCYIIMIFHTGSRPPMRPRACSHIPTFYIRSYFAISTMN